MRTLPKALVTFQEIIKERSARLRSVSFEGLKQLPALQNEQILVESRPSTISVIVQPRPDGSLRVVVQGFMSARFLPGEHVAIDGFYKNSDGTVTPMATEEYYDFD